mmetsp:Transcript_11789/g.42150  ORF Transcript_11789/g.42150 Transcript_11789/m.42150 type:complete len:612 (+) Transcript_11789:141-1976(+)
MRSCTTCQCQWTSLLSGRRLHADPRRHTRVRTGAGKRPTLGPAGAAPGTAFSGRSLPHGHRRGRLCDGGSGHSGHGGRRQATGAEVPLAAAAVGWLELFRARLLALVSAVQALGGSQNRTRRPLLCLTGLRRLICIIRSHSRRTQCGRQHLDLLGLLTLGRPRRQRRGCAQAALCRPGRQRRGADQVLALLRHHPGGNDSDVVLLAALAVETVPLRALPEGHLRGGVQRALLRRQRQCPGHGLGRGSALGQAHELAEDWREGTVHDVQDLAFVQIVPQAVREQQHEVPDTHLKAIAVAIGCGVQGDVGKFAGQRLWQARQLIRAVPTVLLLLRAGDHCHASLCLAQQQEARVAEVRATCGRSIQRHCRDRRRPIRIRALLGERHGDSGTLLDGAGEVLVGNAALGKSLAGIRHEVSSICGSIDAILGELHHATDAICDAQSMLRREVRIFANTHLLLENMSTRQKSKATARLHRSISLRQLEAVDAQPQLSIVEALEDLGVEAAHLVRGHIGGLIGVLLGQRRQVESHAPGACHQGRILGLELAARRERPGLAHIFITLRCVPSEVLADGVADQNSIGLTEGRVVTGQHTLAVDEEVEVMKPSGKAGVGHS